MRNNEIQFIDTSSEVKKVMVKLSKQALRNGAKVVNKKLKSSLPVRTGGLKKSVTAWAKINRKTGQPYLEIGYRSRAQMRKRGVKYFPNPTWFEFGTKPHIITASKDKILTDGETKFGKTIQNPGMRNRNFLRNTVVNNIQAIVDAQKEKLSELTDLMIQEGANIDVGGDEEVE